MQTYQVAPHPLLESHGSRMVNADLKFKLEKWSKCGKANTLSEIITPEITLCISAVGSYSFSFISHLCWIIVRIVDCIVFLKMSTIKKLAYSTISQFIHYIICVDVYLFCCMTMPI